MTKQQLDQIPDTRVITAKFIADVQGCCLSTAKGVAKTIRNHCGVKRLMLKHYNEYYCNV